MDDCDGKRRPPTGRSRALAPVMAALLCLAAGLSLWGLMTPAMAGEPVRLAIIEPDYSPREFDLHQILQLTETMRNWAADEAAPHVQIPGRESLEALLPQDERQDCAEDDCLVTIGRKLQSQRVIGGSLKIIQGQPTLMLQLYDTRSGALVAGETKRLSSAASTPALEEAAKGLITLLMVRGKLAGRAARSRPPPVPTPPDMGQPTVFSAPLAEPTGVLLIERGSPKGAAVTITGPEGFIEVGKLPMVALSGLKPAVYEIHIEHPGYEAWHDARRVAAEESTQVTPALRALASLKLTSNVKGAWLTVIGPEGVNFAGPPPLYQEGLPLGDYQVHGTAKGHEPTQLKLSLGDGDKKATAVNLKALGTLEITGTPEGARVAVTGPNGFEAVGGLPMRIEGAWSGSYTVEVSHEGCARVKVQAHVKPEKTQSVKVQLKHLGPPAAQARAALPRRGGIDWVEIPGGTWMDGGTERKVDGFLMSRTEVTWGQFVRCVRAGVCTETTRHCPMNAIGEAISDAHPMTCVEPEVAKDFADWVGGRLPTWEEWTWAATNGRTTNYPWGDSRVTCERAVINHNCASQSGSQPICSKAAGTSKAGLCDLIGNVTELIDEGNLCTVGGDWSDTADWNYFRVYCVTSNPSGSVGFRVVAPLPPPSPR